MIRMADLFCGIGGFRLGMNKAGYTSIFACDINPYCRQVYYNNYNDQPEADIRSVTNLPDHDIMCAGFPCQSFSIAGRKLGFNDSRGTLFFEIARLVKIKHPKVILLENVEGLHRHDNGNTLQTILGILQEEGYTTSWSVLNASHYGVPQSRTRTIIVASRIGSFSFDSIPTNQAPILGSVLEDNDAWLPQDKYTLIQHPTRQKSGLIFAGYLTEGKPRQRGVDPGKLHLSRNHKQQYRIYSSKGYFPCLSAQELSGRLWVEVDSKVRRLTLRECYRLMGFPDSFINHSPIIEQRKQIGNSICVPMVEAIGREIQRQLFTKSPEANPLHS